MRPLLWKEMRDLRAWVLIGFALLGALELLFQSPSFSARYLDGYLVLFMPFLATLTAVGLGAGQVAKERQTRTLDYLLVRPAPASALVWAKFLAGTAALALLLPALVGVGYAAPTLARDNTALTAITGQVSFWRMTLILFPRFWCIYAVSLLFSVLVDRAAKAGAAVLALGITVTALGTALMDRSPFSSFPDWLPFLEKSAALLRVAKDPAVFWLTGSVFTAAALLLALGSAAFLRRWPERYLGSRALALGSAIAIGAAMLTAHAAPEWLPTLCPAGRLEYPAGPDNGFVDMAAGEGRVAVGTEHGVLFLDFSNPAKPVKTAEIALPLWTTRRVAMAGATAYLLGRKKALPVDETQIALVTVESPDSARLAGAFSLGPVSPREFIAPPLVIGRFLYAGMTRHSQCSLHVFDLSSDPVGRETAVLTIEKLQPLPDGREFDLPFGICRRGSHLYVSSPSALTTIDVRDPAQPVATSKLEFHSPIPSLSVLERPMAWRGERLYEARYWPPSLGSYDLSDAGRPVPKPDLAWRPGGIFTVVGSGRAFYRPWKNGLIEFQPGTSEMEALRYLSDGDELSVSNYTLDGEYVYALKRYRQSNCMEAFWIGQSSSPRVGTFRHKL